MGCQPSFDHVGQVQTNLDKFIPGVEVEDEVVAPAGTLGTILTSLYQF